MEEARKLLAAEGRALFGATLQGRPEFRPVLAHWGNPPLALPPQAERVLANRMAGIRQDLEAGVLTHAVRTSNPHEIQGHFDQIMGLLETEWPEAYQEYYPGGLTRGRAGVIAALLTVGMIGADQFGYSSGMLWAGLTIAAGVLFLAGAMTPASVVPYDDGHPASGSLTAQFKLYQILKRIEQSAGDTDFVYLGFNVHPFLLVDIILRGTPQGMELTSFVRQYAAARTPQSAPAATDTP